MRQRSILIDGLTIEILDSEGEGLPVFACHGNSSAADSFAGLLNSPLGSRYRIMAISLPGHGASSGYAENESEPGYSIEMLGRLLAKVIEAQECKPYVLIGHSLGGHALLEALDHFHGAAGMMLICAPPIAHEVLGQAFQPDPSDGLLFKEGLSEAEALRLAACFSAGRDNDLLQPMTQRILRTAPGFRSALGASLASGKLRDERPQLDTTTIPVAMLAGSADRFLRSDYIAAIESDKWWRGGTIWYDGCGHVPHLEAPERFEQMLAEFLADIDGAGSPRHPDKR